MSDTEMWEDPSPCLFPVFHFDLGIGSALPQALPTTVTAQMLVLQQHTENVVSVEFKAGRVALL